MIKKISGILLIFVLLFNQSFNNQKEAAVISRPIKVPKIYTNFNNNSDFYQQTILDPVDTKLLLIWSLTAIATGMVLVESKPKPKRYKKSIIIPIKNIDYKLVNRL